MRHAVAPADPGDGDAALLAANPEGPVMFYCSVAERTRDGQRFRRVQFRLPRRFAPEDRAHAWFVTEKFRRDGERARTVLCDVPFTTPALNMVARHFMDSLPIRSRPLRPGEFGLPDRGGVVRPKQASLLPNFRAILAPFGEAVCESWRWDDDLGPVCDLWQLEGITATVCGPESSDPACWDWDDVIVIIIDWENPPPPPPPEYDPPPGGGSSNPYDDCVAFGDGDGDSDGDGDGDGGGGDADGDPGDDDECNEDEVVEVESVTVTCDKSTVVRDQDISCHFAYFPNGANNFHVTGWKFQGGGYTRTRSAWPTWQGTVVVGGDITVEYSVDGSTGTFSSSAWSFSVSARNWSWDATSTVLPHSQWTFDGSAPLATSDTFGATCWIDDQGGPCGQAINALQPWGAGHPTSCDESTNLGAYGFICGVVEGGPNDGLWYVTDAKWDLYRRSGIHPEFSTVRAFVPLAGCTSGQGPGTWADYSDACHGINGSGFEAGVAAHESQHVSQADTEAANGDDPKTIVDGMVRLSEAELISAIATALTPINSNIKAAGKVEPTGNFNPGTTIWYFWGGTSYSVVRFFTGIVF